MAHIRIPRPWQLAERLATPEDVFINRRQVLAGLGLGAASLALPQLGCAASPPQAGGDGAAPEGMLEPAVGERFADRFPAPRNEAYKLGGRPLTPEEKSAAYNNFYEFTTTKDMVWKLARGYSVEPWQVEVGGLVKQPRTLDLDDIFTRFPLQERLYRFRCVERWAMQVPWTGYPLKSLIDFLEPLPGAKYVRFVSFLDKERLPGQKNAGYYPWPYYEGLRMDEATHPLAFVVVGSYGHAMPMQHGAPWRLALPWKYGYKSPKSLVRIEFVAERPGTFWNDLQSREYGFYSNVNPGKPHPRWSQARETDIGTGEERDTLLYNGYADEVGKLYTGEEA